jgi:hypothetical protein
LRRHKTHLSNQDKGNKRAGPEAGCFPRRGRLFAFNREKVLGRERNTQLRRCFASIRQ